jgi:hypothetical protein
MRMLEKLKVEFSDLVKKKDFVKIYTPQKNTGPGPFNRYRQQSETKETRVSRVVKRLHNSQKKLKGKIDSNSFSSLGKIRRPKIAKTEESQKRGKNENTNKSNLDDVQKYLEVCKDIQNYASQKNFFRKNRKKFFEKKSKKNNGKMAKRNEYMLEMDNKGLKHYGRGLKFSNSLGSFKGDLEIVKKKDVRELFKNHPIIAENVRKDKMRGKIEKKIKGFFGMNVGKKEKFFSGRFEFSRKNLGGEQSLKENSFSKLRSGLDDVFGD